MSHLVASLDGDFIKALSIPAGQKVYGWHKSFGLIAPEDSAKRMKASQRRNAIIRRDDWVCRFKVEKQNDDIQLIPMDGCTIKRELNGWTVKAANREWHMSMSSSGLNTTPAALTTTDDRIIKRSLLLAMLLFVATITGLLMWTPPAEEKKEELPIDAEPITVVVQKIKTVTVTAISTAAKTLQKTFKQAAPQELGFLGLAGRKDLSKAVGGTPVNLQGSPGAGAGGKEGSGGEMLAGLGKGVRATTVGNSGVQGLGGVGTKGKGGGLGGYGDVAIASGGGAGVSSIGISQGGVGVDGGLDRHVIQATIAKYLSQIRACYEDRLRMNPGLAGNLVMDFEINGAGRLNFSKVKSSTLGDAQVGSCVSTKMMGWEFPKPRGGVNVKVNYPFSLRPAGQ